MNILVFPRELWQIFQVLQLQRKALLPIQPCINVDLIPYTPMKLSTALYNVKRQGNY